VSLRAGDVSDTEAYPGRGLRVSRFRRIARGWSWPLSRYPNHRAASRRRFGRYRRSGTRTRGVESPSYWVEMADPAPMGCWKAGSRRCDVRRVAWNRIRDCPVVCGALSHLGMGCFVRLVLFRMGAVRCVRCRARAPGIGDAFRFPECESRHRHGERPGCFLASLGEAS
jgi:hypothetical protein